LWTRASRPIARPSNPGAAASRRVPVRAAAIRHGRAPATRMPARPPPSSVPSADAAMGTAVGPTAAPPLAGDTRPSAGTTARHRANGLANRHRRRERTVARQGATTSATRSRTQASRRRRSAPGCARGPDLGRDGPSLQPAGRMAPRRRRAELPPSTERRCRNCVISSASTTPGLRRFGETPSISDTTNRIAARMNQPHQQMLPRYMMPPPGTRPRRCCRQLLAPRRSGGDEGTAAENRPDRPPPANGAGATAGATRPITGRAGKRSGVALRPPRRQRVNGA
jgi:hypothetical protein